MYWGTEKREDCISCLSFIQAPRIALGQINDSYPRLRSIYPPTKAIHIFRVSVAVTSFVPNLARI